MEYGLATIALVGFIVLAVVFLIVIAKNKAKDSPADIARTERATKELYEEEHEDGQRHGGNA